MTVYSCTLLYLLYFIQLVSSRTLINSWKCLYTFLSDATCRAQKHQASSSPMLIIKNINDNLKQLNHKEPFSV